MSLYKDLLSKGKEVIEALELPFKVKKEIAKDQLTIQQQKSACPVEWNKLIEAIDKEALNNRKLKQLQELEKEMFLGK